MLYQDRDLQGGLCSSELPDADLGDSGVGGQYAKRTNVERGYSTVKNPDVIGLNKGLFHMRGLPNFSLLVTCMWIAHNLYLRMKATADRLKVTRVGERARRKHRRRNQVPFVVAPDQAGSVPAIELARAP